MNRQEIINDLQKHCGGFFITRGQLAKFMGKKDPHGIDFLLYGLERVEHSYYIRDIADSLIRHKAVRQ